MKNKFLLPMLGLLVCAGFALFSAFERPAEQQRNLYDPSGAVVGQEYFAPGGMYSVSVTPDTLTNAEKDTVNLSDNIVSLYTYDFQVVISQLSGTAGVKVYLDQSARSTNTVNDWIPIDSTASLTNASPRGILDGTDMLGYRYRLRFSGTGTASVKYWCDGRMKKKN